MQEKKSLVKEENYFVVQGWMRTKLNLVGNELNIFAIIYGFCQVENHKFTGSLQYLSDWVGISKGSCIDNLKKLIDKKLIIKEEKDIRGVKFCEYLVNLNTIKESSIGIQESFMPIEESLTNNIEYNINNNILLSKDNNIENLENSKTNTKKTFTNSHIEDLENETKQKKTSNRIKKQTIAIQRVNLINEYTQDEDIKKALLKYLNIRRIKGLELEQWQLMLETFFNKYTTKASQLEQINNAYIGNWMSLVYENKFTGNIKTSYSSYDELHRPSCPDNCADHDTSDEPKFNKMTKEGKRKWELENCVLDENGNPKEY